MHYTLRVRSALGGERLLLAAAVVLLVAAQGLVAPVDAGLWTLQERVLVWQQDSLGLLAVAALMVASYTLVDEALPVRFRGRYPVLCLTLATASALGTWIAAGITPGLPVTLAVVLSESARWTAIGVVIAGVHALRRRALMQRFALRSAQQATDVLAREESEQALQLLQAQIEPHFLFNTLANVRSLCRAQPASGLRLLDSLLYYLRAALPRARIIDGSLGDELDLSAAYLALFSVRMSPRLTYRFDIAEGVRDLEFPPMLLLTLVENAVKHGAGPSSTLCCIEVRAERSGELLRVEVVDDGVGLGSVASGGTGLGLANVRRQLDARYGPAAHCLLMERKDRGVTARLNLPARRRAQTARRDLQAGVAAEPTQ